MRLEIERTGRSRSRSSAIVVVDSSRHGGMRRNEEVVMVMSAFHHLSERVCRDTVELKGRWWGGTGARTGRLNGESDGIHMLHDGLSLFSD